MLTADAIASHSTCQRWQIECCAEIDSTNAELRRRALAGVCVETALFAEAQTAGRGRLERSWHSPKEGGLWFSLLIRPQLVPTQAQLVTLTTAVAVAEALAKLDFPVRIKWPNDILSPERQKLCGIKCEMRADTSRVEWLIIGIGVNVNNDNFPPELQKTATCLKTLANGRPIVRAAVAGAILERLAANLALLEAGDFEQIRAVWTRYAIGLNEETRIHGIGKDTVGIPRGLDAAGYLLFEQDGQIRPLLAGDMILSV